MFKYMKKSKMARRVMTATPFLTIVGASSVYADASSPVAKIDSSVITSAVKTAVGDTISMMAGLLPVALTVFAATWGVQKAIKFFKGASN